MYHRFQMQRNQRNGEGLACVARKNTPEDAPQNHTRKLWGQTPVHVHALNSEKKSSNMLINGFIQDKAPLHRQLY